MAVDEFYERYRGELTGIGDHRSLAMFAIADSIYHLSKVVHEVAYGDENDMGALARVSVMMEKLSESIEGIGLSISDIGFGDSAIPYIPSLDEIEKE